jgi:copper chaperone CopZ
MTTTASYTVSGMTCAHCVSAVTGELSALPGVQDVAVDLVAGGASTVTVTSEAALDAALVRDAVDEAGYELVTGGA